MTESVFFQDLAMLMAVAGLTAVVFSRLGWPKALGYILVGILLNGHTWGGSFLVDEGSTKVFGQLGVVFLMFGMGLSFSARDMRRIRSVALPTAVFDTVMMVWLGFTVGQRVLGWSVVESLFLGVAICDSATTLLAKVIGEMGWGARPFAKYVLGTSVGEDIICVGLIALVTGFANGGGLSALALVTSIWWLVVFFLAVIVFGFVLVPRFLKSVAKRKDDEALVLAMLACCFFVSYYAYRFNFSLALGAFLVGILCSTSDARARLAALAEPLKAMFSPVFFVSIGLLVDPAALVRYLPEILLISAVVVVGKLLNVTFMSLATGLDVKTAIQNGFSLAQIGEFAFMVAILYTQAVPGSTTPLFPIAVGVSLLTTLLNPSMVRLSDRVGDVVDSKLPERVRQSLLSYRALVEKLRAVDNSPAWVLVKTAAIRLSIYAVLIVSVAAVSVLLNRFDYSRFSGFFECYKRFIFFFISNVFTIGLTPLVLASGRSLGDEVALLLTGDGNDKWQIHFRQIARFFVTVAVMVLFFGEWAMIAISVSPLAGYELLISAGVVVVVGAVGWKFFIRAGRSATRRFVEALTAEERREGLLKTMTVTIPEGTVQRLTIAGDSPAVGETVVSLDIRAKTGASVVAVIRDGQVRRNVGPEWEFRIGDTLVALGDPHQIVALKDLLGVTA